MHAIHDATLLVTELPLHATEEWAVSAPDGAAALVVGRGGGVERALVACLPTLTTALGAPFDH